MDINNSRTLSQAIVESKTNNDVIYYPTDSNSVVINGKNLSDSGSESKSYTKEESDAKYATKTDLGNVYTKEESDAKYVQIDKTIINIADIYNVTNAEKDSIYAQKDNIYNTAIVSNGVTYNIAIFSFEEDGAFFLIVLDLDATPVAIYKPSDPVLEMVDLGLPSGLKWAKCNLGANNETKYGDYYMFGSTTPDTYNICYWARCPFNNGRDDYDEDYFLAHKDEWFDDDVLKPEYDAATVNMGEGWRMPTSDDLTELIEGTTSEWITNYNGSGVNGRLFTSKVNTNTLFIPALGQRDYSDVQYIGDFADVWSSSLSDTLEAAWFLDFSSRDVVIGTAERPYGQPIRGVHE